MKQRKRAMTFFSIVGNVNVNLIRVGVLEKYDGDMQKNGQGSDPKRARFTFEVRDP